MIIWFGTTGSEVQILSRRTARPTLHGDDVDFRFSLCFLIHRIVPDEYYHIYILSRVMI